MKKKNDSIGVTSGENVYLRLRNDIIELKLMPGAVISINDICEFLKVSRSPVRDAIIRLESEGLITTMPQRGTMVSKINFKRVLEEHYLRMCLEERVIIDFVSEYNECDILELNKAIEKQIISVKDMNYRELLQNDDDFHKIFFKVTNKLFCWKTIRDMSGHYRRFRLLSILDPSSISNIIEQHQEIVASIINKDIELLKILINKHLSKIKMDQKFITNNYPLLFEDLIINKPKSNEYLSSDFFNTLKP